MAPLKTPNKLPRTFLAEVRPPPLPAPAALYKEILDTLTSMDLKLDADTAEEKPAVRGLAAMLTVGKYFAHAIAQAKASRNAVNLAVVELGKLVNMQQPWPPDAVVAAKRAVEELKIDATFLEWWRDLQCFVRADLGISPLDKKIDALAQEFERGGNSARAAAWEFAAGINDFGEGLLGLTKAIFFAIPGVDTFHQGGVRDVRRDELAQWLAWEVSEYLYTVTCGARGAIDTARWIIQKTFPDLAPETGAADIKGQRFRFKKFFFATKAPLPTEVLRAVGLARYARLSKRFEQLPTAGAA